MLLIPYRITERFIREHPELTFVYSTDLKGHGGLGMQWFMSGPPNSFGVPTLAKFCANPVYFQDSSSYYRYPFEEIFKLYENKRLIDKAIKLIPRNNPIIVPPKIGLGCAKMLEYCPKTYKYLRQQLDSIMSREYKIDYTLPC